MALFQTKLPGNMKPSKIVSQLHGLEGPWEGDSKQWLIDRNVEPTLYWAPLEDYLEELQSIESVEDQEEFNRMGLSISNLYLLVQ